jgi:hypothetical protein
MGSEENINKQKKKENLWKNRNLNALNRKIRQASS